MQDKNLKEWEELISPRGLLNVIKPIIADELVAKYRLERDGLKVTLLNGQKFMLTITEIK